MATERRIEKLNNVFKEEIASILDRESEIRRDAFITVTRVSVSTDLHYANVYLSILDMDPAGIIGSLQKNVYRIQQTLNRRIRMRPVPRINFLIDEEEINREGVEKSIAELKKLGEI